MATIRTGGIVADIRGSVGTVTYGRNRGGAYARDRKFPDETSTGPRAAARAAIKLCGETWSTVLSNAQRTAWTQYAYRWPIPDAWGKQQIVTPVGWFVRVNYHAALGTTNIRWSSPPAGGPLNRPQPAVIATASNQSLGWSRPVSPWTVEPADLWYWAYGGKATSQAVLYYQAPWRYGTGLNTNWNPGGASMGWVTTYPILAGQLIRLKLYCQDEVTGAISPPGIGHCTVQA